MKQPAHPMRTMFYLGIAVLGASLAARAQPTNENVRAMSLADCISIALTNNLDVQIERYNPEIARYNLEGSYGSYDPQFALSAQHNYAKSPDIIDPQGRVVTGRTLEINSFGPDLRGQLPTGLNYDLAWNISDTTGTGIPPTTEFGGGPTISLRQPILKDFWTDASREQIWVDRKALKISQMALKYRIMLIIEQVEQAYYDLIAARENVKVQEMALELAKTSLAQNKKKVEVGALAPLDEKQAQSQVAARQADLLSAQRTLDAQENVLKNLITDEYQAWHLVDVRPTQTLLPVPQQFDLQRSWTDGMEKRPDLIQLELDVQRRRIVNRLNFNQLFPSLDLVGSYGHNATAASFGGLTTAIAAGDSPHYSYGAILTIPLSNIAARNRYKASRAQLKQAQLQVKQLKQNILVQIDDAIKLAKTNFQRVDATHQAKLYAEAALDAEQKKLDNGKSTSFVVLQLQRDLTAARSAEIQALADYNKALSQLHFSEGTTLEQHHIDLRFQ